MDHVLELVGQDGRDQLQDGVLRSRVGEDAVGIGDQRVEDLALVAPFRVGEEIDAEEEAADEAAGAPGRQGVHRRREEDDDPVVVVEVRL